MHNRHAEPRCRGGSWTPSPDKSHDREVDCLAAGLRSVHLFGDDLPYRDGAVQAVVELGPKRPAAPMRPGFVRDGLRYPARDRMDHISARYRPDGAEPGGHAAASTVAVPRALFPRARLALRLCGRAA